jgi:general secretion pathway protein A
VTAAALYHTSYGFRHDPFSLTPDPDFLYLADSHQEALDLLSYGITEGFGFAVLTGEVGTGKTTLVHALLARLPERFRTAYVLDPALQFAEILSMIVDDLGIKAPSTRKVDLLAALHRFLLEEHAQGREVLVILDEAQSIAVPVLDELRMLSNLETDKRKLIHIFLVGQPELDELLERPQIRQLAQRIAVRARLRPLNVRETRAYVAHRLHAAGAAPDVRFTPRAVERVHRYADGIPRLINRVCHAALMAGYVAGARVITESLVDRGWRELAATRRRARGSRARRAARVGWIAVTTLAAALAVAGDLAIRGKWW